MICYDSYTIFFREGGSLNKVSQDNYRLWDCTPIQVAERHCYCFQSAMNSETKSFSHQAATASALAPLVAIMVGAMTNGAKQGLGPQLAQKVSMIVGLANSTLIVLGLGLGVVALFGISKHGAKGILGKALLGIGINAILVAAGITVLIRAKELAGH